MLKTKPINTTKKDISQKINNDTGLPVIYINKIIDDFFSIFINSLKKNNISLKNFGTFKVLYKRERLGRNPKNKKIYKIKSRKKVTFSPSKNLNNKIKIT